MSNRAKNSGASPQVVLYPAPMPKTFRQTRKLSPFFLFLFTLFLTLFLSLPWVNAEEPKPKPQPWEINGIIAALADPYAGVRLQAASKLGEYQLDDPKSLIKNYKDLVDKLAQQLEDKEPDARNAAAQALGQMEAKEQAPKLVELLKDSDSSVRSAAVSALGQMQAKEQVLKLVELLKDSDQGVRSATTYALGQMQAKEQAPKLVELLKDSDQGVRSAATYALGQVQAKEQVLKLVELLKDSDQGVRYAAAPALSKLGQQGLPVVVQILDAVQQNSYEIGELRFLAHFISGGEQEVETLMQWVGIPKSRPEKPTLTQGRNIMKLFDKTWKISESAPGLRKELADKIGEVADGVSWKPQDIVLLQTHYNNLKGKDNAAYKVQLAINKIAIWKWLANARNTILIHAAFWLALIFAYPKFPQVQAIFFWNPWVRKILGVGYVGFLLTWVPYLRCKLFEPFKPSLLADARLDYFTSLAYFPESKVKVPSSEEIKPITEALPSIQGQIVLEGDSGLGKSMFLRHLVNNSPRLVVYLPAQKCDKGVIEAIQEKLHGQAQDAEFLKNLIYSGAIDICIDGLNEVTADTRAKIVHFVECYFRGNIIMTTQPLEWTPPSTAKIYTLQPLERDQIQEFLVSRQPRLPKDAKIQGTDYEKACTSYLIDALNPQQPLEELAAAQRTVSNPMDLSLVSLMLYQGKTPNLFRLQEQQYKQMAEEFPKEWKYEFPLKKFSQAVYKMRLNDEKALPAEVFYQELQSLEDEKYKMVVSRQWKDEKGEAKKEWYFRHDKIMDFFLVQNFLGKSAEAETRLIDHMGDPRFRGVYFLLATLLPLDEAKELREKLIQYAADSKDHTVSDTFVQLLRAR